MTTKYGKSIKDIFSIKQTFIDQNKELLKENLLLAAMGLASSQKEKDAKIAILTLIKPLFLRNMELIITCVKNVIILMVSLRIRVIMKSSLCR
jgi:hypothetical protein